MPDPYPYAALPKLQPGDSTPSPWTDSRFQDPPANTIILPNSQPKTRLFVPTPIIDVNWLNWIASADILDYDLTPDPISTAFLWPWTQSSFLPDGAIYPTSFTWPWTFDATITGGGGGGPHSLWPLNTTAWADTLDGRDLTAVGSVSLGTDGTGSYAVLPNSSSWLEVSGTDFRIASATTVWSWRIAFELRVSDVLAATDIPGPVLSNVFYIYRFSNSIYFALEQDFTEFEIGSIAGLSNTWISIVAEYDAATQTATGTINGTPTTTTGFAHPSDHPTPTLFRVSGVTGYTNANVRNVEFEKITEVNR